MGKCNDSGLADEPFENAPAREFSGRVLIAPKHRGLILAYYRSARGADDVADSPSLSPDAKLALLDLFEATLTGRNILKPTKPVVHAHQHLVDVREFERGRGGVAIFDLSAPIGRKPIFNAGSKCRAEPLIAS
jgi:hypothetical protein